MHAALGRFAARAQVFQFVISDGGDAGKFVLDLKNGSGSAKAGEEGSAAGTSGHLVALQQNCVSSLASESWQPDCSKPVHRQDCTITMADADFVAMAEGKLDGMQAFMGGKLKIKGNMMLAQKLQSILEAAK